MKCIISCEHASNRVPPEFAVLFKGKEKILSSHQAYDPGAAELAGGLARQLKVKPYLGSISRLLIDLNRSTTNRRALFSKYSRKLEEHERQGLLQGYYRPYRQRVMDEIGAAIKKHEPVLHLAIHTFTPVIKGMRRKVDIGLLYDPARCSEKSLCAYLAALLKQRAGEIRVRRNYPYQGKTDGFPAFLRKKYRDEFYAGLEIELNQALMSGSQKKNEKIKMVLAEGIRSILGYDEFVQPTFLNKKQADSW